MLPPQCRYMYRERSAHKACGIHQVSRSVTCTPLAAAAPELELWLGEKAAGLREAREPECRFLIDIRFFLQGF